MAPKGKTPAERLIVLETIVENFTKSQEEAKASQDELKDMMLKKFESIENKIDLRNKVDEMHGIMVQGNMPKSPLQKFGNTARDIKDIILAVIMFLAFMAVLLKVDFSAVLK